MFNVHTHNKLLYSACLSWALVLTWVRPFLQQDHKKKKKKGGIWVERKAGYLATKFALKEGRKEMFYLTTHSTHFKNVYGYMASDMVKDHSYNEIVNPLPPHRLLLLSYFSFQPVLHDWCNKGRGMCYPVCGMVHIK